MKHLKQYLIMATLALLMLPGIARAHYEMNITSVSGAPFCQGESFTVSFGIHFTFNSGNVYTAQLSNASGSFATPVVLGTLSGTGAGTITCQIPAGTPAGNGYRIRIVSSNPVATGDISTGTYVVWANPTAQISSNGITQFCQGDSLLLSATNGVGLTYVWRLNGSAVAGAASSVHYAKLGGNYTVQVTNGGACSAVSSGLNITRRSRPQAVVSPGGTVNACTGATVSLNANTGTNLSYEWSRNNIVLPGANLSSLNTTQGGTFKVKVTNQWGCWKQSLNTRIIRSNCNRTEDEIVSEEKNMRVATDAMGTSYTVVYDLPRLHASRLMVVDASGRLILEHLVPAGEEPFQFDMDASLWMSGIYFLTLYNKDIHEAITIQKAN